MIDRRTAMASGLAAAGLLPGRRSRAQAANTIRIGVITDMSGIYKDVSGSTTVACTRADGCKIHPAYLFQVKQQAESRYPGDVYKLVSTMPAEDAFRPQAEGNCPLVRS